MDKMKIRAILISLVLFMVSYNNIKAMDQDTITKYYIDYVEVTKKKFDNELAKMKETGGWFCKKTNTGGITGYYCKDKLGREYKYICITESKKSECSLFRIHLNPESVDKKLPNKKNSY